MSTGLAVFDSTVQETNVWLKAIEDRLRPCDRQQAYGALRAVLHTLRDRLPTEAVLGLSAQLPMLLRGLLFEGWRPVEGPSNLRSQEAFAQAAAAGIPDRLKHQFGPEDIVRAVFGVMDERLDSGEIRKLILHLPEPLRSLWPAQYWAF